MSREAALVRPVCPWKCARRARRGTRHALGAVASVDVVAASREPCRVPARSASRIGAGGCRTRRARRSSRIRGGSKPRQSEGDRDVGVRSLRGRQYAAPLGPVGTRYDEEPHAQYRGFEVRERGCSAPYAFSESSGPAPMRPLKKADGFVITYEPGGGAPFALVSFRRVR